ncbi:MAG TPA: hypothetical protein VJR89_00995, partial [Polyangiales bacterium]|nr:hypothetical protein [Polyangiales bacterium]
LTRMLWECVRGLPQLRHTPESFSLEPAQRVHSDDHSALAAAFARCTALLGASEVTLYVQPDAAAALEVWPAHPPCIVARSDFSASPVQIFQLAECLTLAEPEHAVAAVMLESEARELLAAMLAAFGPPGSARELDRAGKDLASQLWHAVPVRVQAQLRELVRTKLPHLVYEELRVAALASALRAGLLATHDVRAALQSVAMREDLEIRDAESFEAAYQRSPALREVIRAAFSDGYLAQL